MDLKSISKCTSASGKDILLCTAALEAEYDTVLSQYQEAYANFINLLTKYTSNPCLNSFHSSNVSQQCYNQIWSDQGCTTTAPTVPQDKRYSQLVQDTRDITINAASTISSTAATDKTKCYGILPSGTATPTPKSAAVYSTTVNSTLEKPNSTWTPTGNGTTISTPSTTTTPATCNTGCASYSQCSAAVFDSQTNKCQFYMGDGTITSDSTTASKTVYITILTAHKIVYNLKTRLQNIIDELKTKSADPTLKSYIDGNNKDYIVQKDLLESKYDLLVADNITVNNSLNQYNTANTELNEQKGFVKQQHLSYRFWTIIAIIIFIIVMKMVLGIDSPSGNIMIWTTVIVLACFSLSKPSGFAIMVLILFIFLLKTFKDYFTQKS